MSKQHLRKTLRTTRANLTQYRRKEAASNLFLHLVPQLAPFSYVLSFASYRTEIDTSLINLYLARTQRLLLPKIVDDDLKIFQITDPTTQLTPNLYGINEPDAQLCAEIDLSFIQLVLVPALGFDQQNHRLGYGKGFYDRFLKRIPHAHTIGIGFKEQLVPQLPSDLLDILLKKVALF